MEVHFPATAEPWVSGSLVGQGPRPPRSYPWGLQGENPEHWTGEEAEAHSGCMAWSGRASGLLSAKKRRPAHGGSYLGVEEQWGWPQVLLFQGSHGVWHLPLLYPAGQQHRGLRTQRAPARLLPVPHRSRGGRPHHSGLASPAHLMAVRTSMTQPPYCLCDLLAGPSHAPPTTCPVLKPKCP